MQYGINRKNSASLGIAVLFIAIAFLVTPQPSYADKVTDWNLIALTAEANLNRTNNAMIATDLAYMHVAIYDAVNAIDGRYTVFAVQPASVPTGASQEAAAVEAAYRVLVAIMPSSQTAFLTAEYNASLATIPDGQAKADGMAIGQEVASLYLASRVGDGRGNTAVTYTPIPGPGNWVPTPPAFGSAATPWLAVMRPFAIESQSQFRADPPPAIDSQEYADEFNETKRLGSINSTERTPEQTTLARFYLDTTVPQEARGLRKLVSDRGMSTADAARLYAQLYVSVSDAQIAGWDSKLFYGYWRPITAIRNADTDGNPATEPDPAWTPLTSTPAHPEYPSAHAFISSAFTETLRQFFGTKRLAITMSSVNTGTTVVYDNLDDMSKDINAARIYAGFHFRTACVRGGIIGERVAKYVAKHHFRPILKHSR